MSFRIPPALPRRRSRLILSLAACCLAGCGSATAPPTAQAPAKDEPVTSSFQPGFETARLTDNTDAAWGAANLAGDTWAGIRLAAQRQASRIRIQVFSPNGQAHLRDVRVVTAGPGAQPQWRPVRARLQGEAAFGEKVRIPALPDAQWAVIEIDPSDASAGAYWGVACYSETRGDQRNYLGKSGDGIYIRELKVE